MNDTRMACSVVAQHDCVV